MPQPPQTFADIAAALNARQRGMLMTGRSDPLKQVTGHNATKEALQRRGLIDNRDQWTSIGAQVAEIIAFNQRANLGEVPVPPLGPGEMVTCRRWVGMVFEVRGTSPHQDTAGVWSEMVQIVTPDGVLSGYVDPRELSRI